MKKFYILLILLSLSSICFSQKPRSSVKGHYLLQTEWGGANPLNMYAPNGKTLGCHSNAFSQILFYHKLSPNGEAKYKCSDETEIYENFSAYNPHWEEFALDAKYDGESLKNTAQFMYYVAIVVRKDFGTDQYVDFQNDFHKKAIESHFDCMVTPYMKKVKSNLKKTLKMKPDFYEIMKKEIDAERPIGFYYTDNKGGGHAIVIDGYQVKKRKTFFHANFGWHGKSNGWYLLEKDLPTNIKMIALILIKPNS